MRVIRKEIPDFIFDWMLELLLEMHPVAWLVLGEEGCLQDAGGALADYALEHLVLGKPAVPQALFLEGILPLDQGPVLLPAMEVGEQRYADIHLVPYPPGVCVILIDATQRVRWRGTAQQKANELNLLRRRLSMVEQAVREQPGLETLAIDCCGALDMLSLELMDEDTFRICGSVPPVFERLYPELRMQHEQLRPEQLSPFVEHFLDEAKEVWRGAGERHRSGPWLESDNEGEEHAIEAVALLWKGRRLLIFELRDEVYRDQLAMLQLGRENALIKRFLEQEVSRRTAEIRAREEEIALRLVWAAESREDGETGTHIRRLGLYCEAMARALGWDSTAVDEIRIAATMHDIGKIGIPDHVLRKPGPLTAAEFEIMKTHALTGGRILSGSRTSLLQMAKDIALGHHEKWDGSGYPFGLSREDIPIAARIAAIADVFDALVHERIYKRAIAVDEAIATMRAERGRGFDPTLFDLFMSLEARFREIAENEVIPLFGGFDRGAL